MTSLQKKIGFWSATSIIIGSIIGSGVFMKPSSMAAELGTPVWLTLVWVIAGGLSLIGALVFAELGAMIPETGGIYIYFRYMYGDFFAFLYGWAAFAVINTASVAAIAFVCAQYADYFLHLPRFSVAIEHSVTWHIPFIGDLYPIENFGVKSLAIVLIMGLTWLNYLSVKAGSALQVVSTFLKMGVIAALIFGIFFSGNGSIENFVHAEHPKQGWNLFGGILAALTGAFFAFDGWINIGAMAGEVRNPEKNIPRSLFIGLISCILVYLLINQAYLYALPVETVAQSTLVASDAIDATLGNASGAIVAAMIVICTFGAINGNTMANARITYAMGKDKVFFPALGKEHPRFHTPGNSLWIHGVWTCVLAITGSFDMLANMLVFVTWIAYLFGALGIFILRKKLPDLPRPYKVWGYPLVPLLFIIFSAFFLVSTIWNDVKNYINNDQPVVYSLLGLLINALGIPFYYYFKGKKQ